MQNNEGFKVQLNFIHSVLRIMRIDSRCVIGTNSFVVNSLFEVNKNSSVVLSR